MSREIVEAMKALAVEKGIAPDRLVHALEDALLSAYKKQPGAAKYARVEMDPDTGDYRVIDQGGLDHRGRAVQVQDHVHHALGPGPVAIGYEERCALDAQLDAMARGR